MAGETLEKKEAEKKVEGGWFGLGGGSEGSRPEPEAKKKGPKDVKRFGTTLKEKVTEIKKELSLDESLGMGAAIKAANEAMGIEGKGTLPQQVDKIVEAMGVDPRVDA